MTLEAAPSPLPPATAAAVAALARLATSSDGVGPLSEQTLLHLDGEHPGDVHLLAYDGDPDPPGPGVPGDSTGANSMSGDDDGGDSGSTGTGSGKDSNSSGRGSRRLIGYACLGPDGSAEVVVAPTARRQGIGSALLRSLRDRGGSKLRVWAHGRLPGVDELAARTALSVVRELYFLRRAAAPVPPPVWPDGIDVRTFVPGQDDEAWLALNARAFADHPEQGGWGASDLVDRIGQPWFDPGGFFLAVSRATGELAGFHWTKTHDAEGPAPYGEVYVVGVDPAHQGTGLGKALTLEGVRHLQEDRGLSSVVLYVDGTNTAARALYEKLGFTTATLDVQYAPTPTS